MLPLLDSIFRLDEKGDYREILYCLQKNAAAPHLVAQEVCALLLSFRFLEAYVAAKLFQQVNRNIPVLALAQAVGGYVFGQSADETQGTAALSDFVDLMPESQQANFLEGILQPVIDHLVKSDDTLVRDHDKALRVLEIFKAGARSIREIFDWSADIPTLDAEELVRQGRARATLISFAEPPAGAPRRPLRAIVALRERVFSSVPNSRFYDMGPRVADAMTRYGWNATHFPLGFLNMPADYVRIVAECEQQRPDMLFLDDYPVLDEIYHAPRAAMIARLRDSLPDMKIVSIHLDPWEIPTDYLLQTSQLLDGVWAHFPSMPVWRDPSIAHKMIYVPLPHAGQSGVPTTPLTPAMTFSGGVFAYNWHRIFWLAAVRYGLPLTIQHSTHREDGLSVIDSYGLYMKRIEASGCSVNFSMRPNLSRILTGRLYETILAGALLVQEDTPDMDYYFVRGEHFLNFNSFAELRAIARFIADRPEEAEKIRREGNEFARTHYNDEKLIGYLDALLFYRQ